MLPKDRAAETVRTETVVVGAGPIGLELGVALKEVGADYVHLDAGQIGQTVSWYPRRAHFFSSPERIAIAGVPLSTSDQTKATREEYLAYLRAVVDQFDLKVRTYERVTRIERLDGVPKGDGPRFRLATQGMASAGLYEARNLVIAMGDMHRPRRLGIPGEDLDHVSHYFDEPHRYFRRRLLIVGGRNSAVEAAIRCHRAGAQVALSYRQSAFDGKSVKYWLKPEIEWLIESSALAYYPQTVPRGIERGRVVLSYVGFDPAGREGRGEIDIAADFVLLLTGYEMDATLFEMAGVELRGESEAPVHDAATMETNVPGLYVAGTCVAGTQVRFKLFIENCHPHVVRIVRALTGHDPKNVNDLAYSRLHEEVQLLET